MKVELVRRPYGDDLLVVNAARVSFDKQSEWEYAGIAQEKLSEADTRLIQFLARGMTAADFDELVNSMHDAVIDADYWIRDGANEEFIDLLWQWRRNPTHWAPFAHPHATFRIKAPIFVARQLAKHQIGMTWSEVSRRYISSEPEFYIPDGWRKKADNVKQGSSEETVETSWDIQTVFEATQTVYNDLLKDEVCPELARSVLPLATYTEWIWTGSLYAWANVFNQRKPGGHAQRECWPIAEQIAYHMAQYFPVSWKALTQ